MKRILIVSLAIGLMLQAVRAEDVEKDRKQSEERREQPSRDERRSESRQRDSEKKPLVVIRKEKEKERPN